eukprot:scaffold12678_cov116-Cylindrotheca_fusiformis.AAC.2
MSSDEVIDLCFSTDEDETHTTPPPANRRSRMESTGNHRPATASVCSADSQEFSSSMDSWLLKRQQIEYYKFHCFSCKVPLCHPKHRNLEHSCYALHEHPILKIPVCSVCSDEIAAKTITTTPMEDVCGICADSDPEQLFLCDNPNCVASAAAASSEVCDQCVRKANPLMTLEEMEASDQTWFCPACQPTSTIHALQKYVEALQQQQETSSSSRNTRDDFDSLVNDLATVEQKKSECEQALEKQEEVWEEIREECLGTTNGMEEAEEEFECWKEQQEKHYSRLVDMITTLQEELERRGFNLKEYYMATAADSTIATPNPSKQEEPEWKRVADMAIAMREREERKQGPPMPPPPEEEEDDDDRIPDDVEDLGSFSDTDQDAEAKAQWRSSQYRAQPWQIQRALQAEEQLLSQQQERPVPTRILESQDAKAIVEEDRQSARVRKDSSIVVQHCRQQQQQQQRRRRPQSTTQKERTPQVIQSNGRYSSGFKSSNSNRNSTSSYRNSNGEGPDLPDNEMECASPAALEDMELFAGSSCILTSDPHQETIRIAGPLDRVLKPHQKEGVQFMFQNTFFDLAFPEDKLTERAKKDVGGCILAHNMGLDTTGRRFIHNVILVAPVNTIRNWENEFEKWTRDMRSSIRVYNLAENGSRSRTIHRWAKEGGVLLTSDALFRGIVKKMEFEEYLRSPGPDAIILDEAHIMLKNKNNAVFKALHGVRTRRRICLTGSPFQNNLFEFFRMASYVRPGILGHSEGKFEKSYVNPIIWGMSTDATKEAKLIADEKLIAIQDVLKPYVNRKDASILLKDLPPMQQVVLHIRQTSVQRSLYGAYRKYQQSSEDKDSMNFLRMYSALRPIHNHPGCLLLREPRTAKDNDTTFGDRRISEGQTMQNRRSPLTPADNNLPPSNSKETSDVQCEGNILKIKQEIVAHREKEENEKDFESKGVDTVRKQPDDADVIELLSDSEDEIEENVSVEDGTVPEEWWSASLEKVGLDKLRQVESGNKVLLLLHILTLADKLNEKVVLFSQCLKTLDFISSVISQDDWPSLVPSIARAFPGHRIGGWKAGYHFLRIDGATSAGDRGNLISQFNEDSVRLFLISSRAGGIGINLCSASRVSAAPNTLLIILFICLSSLSYFSTQVVLFDSNFNPSVDMQALYRCYRYGQKRDVFAYRFLTEGTTEGKVYSRAVNKSSLALSLVDGKTFNRVFSKEETADCTTTDHWCQCDRCDQWRMFPPNSVDPNTLPDQWYCEMMNEYDKTMTIDCTFPQKDEPWYFRHYAKAKKQANGIEPEKPIIAMSGSDVANLSKEKKEKLAARDAILMHLLGVSASQKKKSKVVSRYAFHDALLDSEEMEKVTSSSKGTPQRSLSRAEGKKVITNTENDTFCDKEGSLEKRTAPRVNTQNDEPDDPLEEKTSESQSQPAASESSAAKTMLDAPEPRHVVPGRTCMSVNTPQALAGPNFKQHHDVPDDKMEEKTSETEPRPKKRSGEPPFSRPRRRLKLDFKSLWAGDEIDL